MPFLHAAKLCACIKLDREYAAWFTNNSFSLGNCSVYFRNDGAFLNNAKLCACIKLDWEYAAWLTNNSFSLGNCSVYFRNNGAFLRDAKLCASIKLDREYAAWFMNNSSCSLWTTVKICLKHFLLQVQSLCSQFVSCNSSIYSRSGWMFFFWGGTIYFYMDVCIVSSL